MRFMARGWTLGEVSTSVRSVRSASFSSADGASKMSTGRPSATLSARATTRSNSAGGAV